MIDPSLLCKADFWEAVTYLESFLPLAYPKNIEMTENADFRDFYGAYLRRLDILNIEEVIARCRESLRPFFWMEYSRVIPEALAEGFATFRRALERSYLPHSIQNVLLDEFVFLATQSSIISRIKKPFTFFERFDAIPLLNLEKRAPAEWKSSVRGIKNVVSLVNWIAVTGGVSIWLGPVAGLFVGSGTDVIRLILIDPK